MARTRYSDSTIVKVAKTMIYQGSTWEDLEKAFSLTRSTIRPLLKASYKTEIGYNNLLSVLRENRKQRNEAQKSLSTNSEEEVQEVIVTESGYMMENGVHWLYNESLPIFIPHFCINELEKLSRSYPVASELLQVVWGTSRISTINLKGKETLFEEPAFVPRKRSIGVTALCCDLISKGFKVRLFTNSREIASIASLQGYGSDFKVILQRINS